MRLERFHLNEKVTLGLQGWSGRDKDLLIYTVAELNKIVNLRLRIVEGPAMVNITHIIDFPEEVMHKYVSSAIGVVKGMYINFNKPIAGRMNEVRRALMELLGLKIKIETEEDRRIDGKFRHKGFLESDKEILRKMYPFDRHNCLLALKHVYLTPQLGRIPLHIHQQVANELGIELVKGKFELINCIKTYLND